MSALFWRAFVAVLFLCAATAFGTNYTWQVGTGNWTDAARWDPDGVPGLADFARISTGNVTVNSTQVVGALLLSGGTLNLNSDLRVDREYIQELSGVLTGVGTLTVDGLLTWTAGTMSGTGTVVANDEMFLETPGQKVLNGRTINSFNNTTWSGGVLLWTAGQYNQLGGALRSHFRTFRERSEVQHSPTQR